MDMRQACHAYLDSQVGMEPQTPRPMPVSLSDEELERVIVTLSRKPAAARALARVLQRAVKEGK
jgi:hypothetical protein